MLLKMNLSTLIVVEQLKALIQVIIMVILFR